VDGFRDSSADLVLGVARPSSHDAVLDYACGVGMTSLALCAGVSRVEAVDELPDSLDEGRRLAAEIGARNISFGLADLYTLPFEDGAFSLVVCRGAFHRLPEPVAALREMARVLSRGGRIVIVDTVVDEVTDTPLNDLARLREPSHRRLYRPEELGRFAARAGLAVTEQQMERRTIDLGYWLQAADVSTEKGDMIRSRFLTLSPAVQERLDLAFADNLVSFSYDAAALRLERERA